MDQQMKQSHEIPAIQRSNSDGLLFKSSIDTIKLNLSPTNHLLPRVDQISLFKDSQNIGEQRQNERLNNQYEEHKIQINDKLDESAYFEVDEPYRKKSKQLKALEHAQSEKDNNNYVRNTLQFKKKSILFELAKMGINLHLIEYVISRYEIDLIQDNKQIIQEVTEQVFEIQNTLEKLKEERQNVGIIRFDSSSDDSDVEMTPKKETIINSFKGAFRIRRTNLFQNKRNPLYQPTPTKMANNAPQPLIKPENLLSCLICLGEMDTDTEILSCGHQFCRNCLSEYLQNKIKISDVMAITCPFDGCKTLIESKEIEKLVEEAIYKKYLRFRLMKELEHDDSVRWCIRPGCEKYMKGNFMSTIVTCECGQQVCYQCRSQAHPGQSCEECPKCSVPIQKNDGCNHMTCFKCRFSFCWLCRARYTPYHFQVYNCFGCPGRQFTKIKPYKRSMFNKYCGIIVESLLIFPFWPLILFIKAIIAPFKLAKKNCASRYKKSGCWEFLCFFFLSLLLSPFFMIIQIIPGLCIYFWDKIKYD